MRIQLDKGVGSVQGVGARVLERSEKVNFRAARNQPFDILRECKRSRNEMDEVRPPLRELIKCVDREVHRR